MTTNILEADRCVSWLGANQPGINQDLGLPPYDPSVCPEGTRTRPSSAIPAARSGQRVGQAAGASPRDEHRPSSRATSRPAATPAPASPAPAGGSAPGLDLPGGAGPATSTTCSTSRARSTGRQGSAAPQAAQRPGAPDDLLDFLFGN